MHVSMKQLGLDQLNADQRLRLAEELWDSLVDSPGSVPVTEAQLTDLARRLDAYRGDPKAGSSWEDVRARLSRPKPDSGSVGD